MGLALVFSCLEGRWVFSFLNVTPLGNGRWRVTLRTGISKCSNSKGAIGTNKRVGFIAGRVEVFMAVDGFNQASRRGARALAGKAGGARARRHGA